MKKIFSIFLVFQFSTAVFAQVKITNQPGDAYYEEVKSMAMNKIPNKDLLLAQKPAELPVAMLDTLKKYDWYNIGGYNYTDKQFDSYFEKELFNNEKEKQYQFNFFRIESDGTKADFSLSKFKTETASITTTSFAKGNCQIYSAVKKVKTDSFIQSIVYGESEYLKIVSYKNGVLIVDITISGKITDTKTRFRIVYYAVPKKFSWSF